MNQTVKRIVDLLFEDTVENEETKALHEELMNNCQEHFEDLVSRGLTEDEATEEVVESLKGMKDVIAEYPKKSGYTQDPFRKDEPAGRSWTFTGIEQLLAETTDQELCVSPSADGAIHVACDDPEGLTCEQTGSRLVIRGVKKRDRKSVV